MKRFRIWINSFNLVQQYLVVSFAAILVFFLFIFQFLNTSIDNFTSTQMISYLRRSQASFINAKDLNLDYVDNNAFHYAYDLDNNVFINYYSEDANKIIAYEDLNSIESEKSGILFFGEKKVVYLIKNCGSFYLISIISEEYHNELYGFLQAKATDEDSNNCHEKEFEKWLVSKGCSKSMSWIRIYKGVAQPSMQMTPETYIRNFIHHPENERNLKYSIQELTDSIDKMKEIAQSYI